MEWTPSTSTDWNDFYNGTVKPFADLKSLTFGNTLSDGTVVESKGTATDFMNRVFGISPLSGGEYTNLETGESVAAGTGAPDIMGIDFGGALARITIIILGFIFVAVGLSMFKNPVMAVVGGMA